MLHDVQRRRRSLLDRFFIYLEDLSPSDRVALILVGVVFMGATMLVLIGISQSYTEINPSQGGTYTEGIIGTPRFVNPVLAITRADHDLVALVYSGLMKLNSEGFLENSLAESITVSDDGKVYNVILREHLTFHDGTLMTTADVAFTISLIQNPELKSPLRGNWNGVSVEVVSDREINFVLEEAYVPFLENFTVGILPKHLWNTLTTEELPFSHYNIEPIGTGPYQVVNVERNKSGLIKAYMLRAVRTNNRVPNIDTVVLNFYPNEAAMKEAFLNDEIMGSASLPNSDISELSHKTHRISQPLPRVFGVFINQNRAAALRDRGVREALNTAINRDELVETVLGGFGTPVTTPLPAGFFTSTNTPATTTDNLQFSRELLTAAGWEQNETGEWIKEIDETETTLAITLATANTPVFEETAEYLKQTWEQLGIPVTIQLFEQTDLVQTVIRPRDYQVLLFGTEVGRSLDLYPFWHSSQREDPGLNIALYTNIKTDDLLREIRTAQDDARQNELMNQIITEIATDVPAIFLFSPAFVYLVDQRVSVVPVPRLSSPSERFSTIEHWYMKEEALWPVFNTDS